MLNGIRLSAAQGEQPATLYIYDDIGPAWAGMVGGKTVADLVSQLPDGAPLDVRINSVGGDVYEGTAIYNLLAQRGNVRVFIDGAALSAASLIAMAGDEIHMAANATMMIHDPWTITWGSPDDLVNDAALLEKTADQLAATYAARTGHEVKAVRDLMRNETWLTADEALAQKFITAVIPSKGLDQVPASAHTIKRFRNTPQRMAAMFVDRAAMTQEPNHAPAPAHDAATDAVTAAIGAAIADRDAAVAERDNALAARDAASAERDQAVADRDTLATLAARLGDERDGLSKQLAQANAALDAANGSLTTARQNVNEREQRIKQLDEQIKSLRGEDRPVSARPASDNANQDTRARSVSVFARTTRFASTETR